MQWISLLMLTMGVALVQMPADTFSTSLDGTDTEDESSKVITL